MKIDAAALMAALDERRHALGELRSDAGGEAQPLTWVEVAGQVGTHSATFSRLKAGRAPGEATYLRLTSWLGVEPEAFCSGCDAQAGPCEDCQNGQGADVAEVSTDGEARTFGILLDPETGDPVVGDDGEPVECSCEEDDDDYSPDCDCSTDEPDDADDDADSDAAGEGEAMAAIYGWGSLSDSQDEDTKAKVGRVAELLAEGAVGVSIMHDLNPDDMPSQEEIDALIEAEDFEKLDGLFADVKARPRHVAIVDTPAFSDARLKLGEDGLSVEGPVAFEGTWTGDIRQLPYGVLTWDDDLLPIPIVIDHDGGSKEVVGKIERLERQDGVAAALRPAPVSDAEIRAVAAAAGGDIASALPARYVERFRAKRPEPLHIERPDGRGLRRVWGHAAPKGVCHRSDMGACFTYPGDVDKTLRGFHTGSPVALDDGTTIRLGALTLGGGHVDLGLSRRGVSAREINRHREDANEVFAMVRAWEDQYGLAISGVVMPSVTDDQVLRALACAPSVELWPERSGRTLVGIHLVPTPAWPVAASAGSALSLTQEQRVEPGEAPEAVEEVVRELEAEEAIVDLTNLDHITDSLSRVEKALALLVADRLTDVPVVEDAANDNDADSANNADSANESAKVE